MKLKSGDGLCDALRGVRVINIGDSLTHQLVETWRVCRVPFFPVFLISFSLSLSEARADVLRRAYPSRRLDPVRGPRLAVAAPRGSARVPSRSGQRGVRGRGADFGSPTREIPLRRHRRDPLQNAGERGASRRRGRSPTATPTKRARRATCPKRSTWRTSSRARRAAADGGGASARTRRRARMPSARRGSAATPTSNACVSRVWFFFVLLISPLRHRRDPPARRRTGPRSSSSSRSGLGASSPGPSRSTTRAWPSAARPSGTRRATSRRTFAASSLSLLCSVARTPAEPAVEPTPRRCRDARTFRSVLCRGGRAAEPIVEPTREPTAEPRTPSTPSPRRSNTAGTRRASHRSGGRSSARARSRRTRRSARSGSSGTRPSARAWPWSTTASRTSRASRVSRVLLVLVSSSFWRGAEPAWRGPIHMTQQSRETFYCPTRHRRRRSRS